MNINSPLEKVKYREENYKKLTTMSVESLHNAQNDPTIVGDIDYFFNN